MRRRVPQVRTRQDFLALQETVYDELRSSQDRVRHLIGGRHWQTDGEHKEEVLRNTLRARLPEDMRIGKGFVCIPHEHDGSLNKSSGQIDVLITERRGLTLYKQGELVFVTADTVEAVMEVKTEVRRELQPRPTNRSGIVSVIKKLADQVQLVRENGNDGCWAGLFVYERGAIDHKDVLNALLVAANGNKDRVVNCVSVGSDIFTHYWTNGAEVGSPINGPVWHAYDIERLAPAYFVNNVAIHLSPQTPDAAQQAWFPIEGGKETRRCCYVALSGNGVQDFS